jgi:hypothetical protein
MGNRRAWRLRQGNKKARLRGLSGSTSTVLPLLTGGSGIFTA